MPECASRWEGLRAAVSHALAMPSPLDISPEDEAVIGKVVEMIARRRLTVPALMALEMSRPINFVASQFLVFVQPFATVLLNAAEYERFTRILEHRDGLGALIERINERAEHSAPAVASPPES